MSVIRTSLASLALLSTLATASAAEVDARASYVLTVGGINVATMNVDLTDDGANYALDVAAEVAGLGTLVASGTAEAHVSGSSAGPRLLARQFALETRANGEQFNVDVTYDGRNVSSFVVEPPVLDSYDRVAIERRHLTNVGDFVSGFVLKGAGLDESLCQNELNVFTGVERFDIDMRYVRNEEATSPRTGYQGPVVLCSLDYKPISGHYTSSEMTSYLADTSRILIWYAPLGETGYYIPYRVLLGTAAGDLSMVLVGTSL